MKIGFVGCGKLGLMVALAIESCGHEVMGYDINPKIADYLGGEPYPFTERDAAKLFRHTSMRMVLLAELCEWADMLFLAPQTPHAEIYEGHLPLPKTRADFDYSYLVNCVQDVNKRLIRPTVCVLISTVLPGIIEREVLPLLGPRFDFVYSPQFIAMGTVYHDFLHPEFWLIGARSATAALVAEEFYRTISPAPALRTDLRTAEGIKVFYNTFITAKTVLANLYGEMSARLGMNVDDIYRALSLATDRLISPKYLKAGMGDGGGCHPRDNIALSYIAQKCGLSFDFFTALMTAREKHCEWLADLIEEHRNGLPVYILGLAFKPETNIQTGSPAVLLRNLLIKRGIVAVASDHITPVRPGLYFIGCQHERYKEISFPAGSVVIDPFRYLPEQEGVSLIQIGKHDSNRNRRTLQSAH